MFRRARASLLAAVILPIAAALAAPAPASARDCKDQDLMPSTSNAVQIRGALRCLINEQRRTRGRAPVTANRALRRAAESYAELMVKKHFESHIGPGGSTIGIRIRKTGYLDGAARWVVGENLGDGEDPRSTPRELMKAWMASSLHRQHILDDTFRDVGVGVVRGMTVRNGGPGATYCVEFGRVYKR